MQKNSSDESDFGENEISRLNSASLFNLNQKQISEIFIVVALMMRKKVLNIK